MKDAIKEEFNVKLTRYRSARTGKMVLELLHDADGPQYEGAALVTRKFDPDTGHLIREVMTEKGHKLLGTEGDAYHANYDPLTGLLCQIAYLDNPARWARDLPTEITSDCYGREFRYVWGHIMPERAGDKPAWVEIDPVTQETVREEYWKDGRPHRLCGDAVIVHDPATGTRQGARYVNGHRLEDQPEEPIPMYYILDPD